MNLQVGSLDLNLQDWSGTPDEAQKCPAIYSHQTLNPEIPKPQNSGMYIHIRVPSII